MSDLKTIEQLAEIVWPDAAERTEKRWIFDAAKAHMKWGQGKETGEAEFRAAIDEVLGLKVGGGERPDEIPLVSFRATGKVINHL